MKMVVSSVVKKKDGGSKRRHGRVVVRRVEGHERERCHDEMGKVVGCEGVNHQL